MPSRIRLLIVVVVVIVGVAAALVTARQARRRDAPPAATPAARTATLEGVWQAMNTAAWDIQDHSAEPFPGLPARFAMPAGAGVVDGDALPYQPWALARRNDNHRDRSTADPEASCDLPGVPRITYMPYPFQIVRFPDRVVIVYEYLHATREIFTDGSPHSTLDFDFWMGDSRGTWDGDSLVVDVTKFTDQTWFDRAGNFHSNALHVTERYTPVDADHLAYEATIEDPKVFTRAWTMRMPLYRRQEREVRPLEFECYAYAREGATVPAPVH
jgi:hypothetical protein